MYQTCPCGETPENIGYVAGAGFSFAYSGDCDCEWTVHFDCDPPKDEAPEDDAIHDQAVKAWNDAPRQEDK